MTQASSTNTITVAVGSGQNVTITVTAAEYIFQLHITHYYYPIPPVSPGKFVTDELPKWRGYACNPQTITGMGRPLRKHGLSRQ